MSFRREKFVPKGGPDGGDGGKGGDIILRVDPHLDNLTEFFYQPHLRAKKGTHGQGKKKHGRGGKDTIARVPPGTLVYLPAGADDPRETQPRSLQEEGYELMDSPDEDGADNEDLTPPDIGPLVIESEEDWPDDDEEEAGHEESRTKEPGELAIVPADMEGARLLADLTEPGQEYILCRGGRGGRGNVHFKSSVNRAPRRFERGGEGEAGHFILEMRQIADAGLVGYPNAGKSTLISKLSAAQPKIAAYPFTTLRPVIGVVSDPDDPYRKATIADIPGLIEGAHENIGLGHDFLRHIMRCGVLVHVVDISGFEARNPLEDLAQVRRELDLYNPTLSEKPWFIAANKMDLPGAEENLSAMQSRYGRVEIIPITAMEGKGVDAIIRAVFERLDRPSQPCADRP